MKRKVPAGAVKRATEELVDFLVRWTTEGERACGGPAPVAMGALVFDDVTVGDLISIIRKGRGASPGRVLGDS